MEGQWLITKINTNLATPSLFMADFLYVAKFRLRTRVHIKI